MTSASPGEVPRRHRASVPPTWPAKLSARDREATSARAAPASGANVCCMLVAWEWKGTGPARDQPSAGQIPHQ